MVRYTEPCWGRGRISIDKLPVRFTSLFKRHAQYSTACFFFLVTEPQLDLVRDSNRGRRNKRWGSLDYGAEKASGQCAGLGTRSEGGRAMASTSIESGKDSGEGNIGIDASDHIKRVGQTLKEREM
jgi:hypothetical protein